MMGGCLHLNKLVPLWYHIEVIMKTATLRQTKSIRLENSDWLALAQLAKAHNRSVNNFLETLVKAAIASSQTPPLTQNKEEFEQEVLRAMAEIDAGKVAFKGSLEELRKRYEGV